MCDSESECWNGRLDSYSERELMAVMPCYATCKNRKIGKRGKPKFEPFPPPFSERIDAWAWNGCTGMDVLEEDRIDYFFSGDQVLTYTLWHWERQDRRVKMPPMKISEHPIFKELPPPFNEKIDAISWNGGHFSARRDLIFSGDQVIEYTLWSKHPSSRVLNKPKRMSERRLFANLPPPFNQKIDAITSNGIIGATRIEWVFSGDQVVEFVMYSGKEKRMREPPMNISAHPYFSELPPPFNQKVDAVAWNGALGQLRIDYIFSGDQVLEYKLYEYALKKTLLQNGKRLQWPAVKLGAQPEPLVIKVEPMSMQRA